MSRDKTFLALKNIIHNELGITRSEIMEMVKDCIHEVVERQVQSAIKGHQYSINDRISAAIDKRAASLIKSCEWVSKNKIYEYFAKEIIDKIDVEIVPKIIKIKEK